MACSTHAGDDVKGRGKVGDAGMVIIGVLKIIFTLNRSNSVCVSVFVCLCVQLYL